MTNENRGQLAAALVQHYFDWKEGVYFKCTFHTNSGVHHPDAKPCRLKPGPCWTERKSNGPFYTIEDGCLFVFNWPSGEGTARRFDPFERIQDVYLLEDTITTVGGKRRYVDALQEIVGKRTNSGLVLRFDPFRVLHAKPAQRTQALLEIMNRDDD
jgi:hypothetical protein